MWNKILEINGRKRFGNRNKENEEKSIDEAMGVASPEKMKGVNSLIRLFLSAVEVPVFGAAVMTIVILGEWNFWSQQVNWQTEPMASVGKSYIYFLTRRVADVFVLWQANGHPLLVLGSLC